MSSKTIETPVSPLQQIWAKLCAEPALADWPYKIETTRSGKIIMSPAAAMHGWYQSKIDRLLGELMPGWEGMTECAIETVDGVKVPDVAGMSREFWNLHCHSICLPVAPEICVEVASPSNSRKEMLQKMRLYFKAGAQEVWFCDKKGRMEFWGKPGAMKASRLCPDFPKLIKS